MSLTLLLALLAADPAPSLAGGPKPVVAAETPTSVAKPATPSATEAPAPAPVARPAVSTPPAAKPVAAPTTVASPKPVATPKAAEPAPTAAAPVAKAPIAPAGDPPPVDWKLKPTPAQVADAFPAAAKAKGLSGSATLACALKEGALSTCAVRSEWPKEQGFGAAALKLAPLYKAETPDQAATVRIEWRQPTLDKAEAAAKAGDYSGIDVIPAQQVVWARRPTAETVGMYYPKAAADEKLGGTVDLLCLIGLRGAPQDCKVIEETPADYGFGAGAKRGIAPRMEAAPLAGDGKPSQGRAVQIKIAFQGAAPTPTAAAPTAAPTDAAAAKAAAAIKELPWAGGPTPEQLEKAFPPAAKAAGVSGRSTIACKVNAAGEMTDCKVVSEEPSAAGFGAAALSVAPFFKLKPKTDSGRSVEGATIRIPLVWTAPGKPVIKPSPTGAPPAPAPSK